MPGTILSALQIYINRLNNINIQLLIPILLMKKLKFRKVSKIVSGITKNRAEMMSKAVVQPQGYPASHSFFQYSANTDWLPAVCQTL